MNKKVINIGIVLGNCLGSMHCHGAADQFMFMKKKHFKRNDQSICDFQEIEKNNSQFIQEIGHGGKILYEWEKICPCAEIVPDKPYGKRTVLHENIKAAVRNKNPKDLVKLLKKPSSQNIRDKFIKKYPFLLHDVIRFYTETLENTATINSIIMIINHLIKFGYFNIPDESGKTPSELWKEFSSKCQILQIYSNKSRRTSNRGGMQQ
ncbi:MAG: hypothetical protein LBI77_03160 [Puniceicoccales bacterium]|jgi:hypothetical protein|nr:hypothetical protein [Puniceicoccales bacterium]